MKILDVIKCEQDNALLVWKHPAEDFNTASTLIVHESQEAVFFKNGQVADVFPAGRYVLKTENIPVLRRIMNLPTGGESTFHCEVYFVNKVENMALKWGTDHKVQFIEPTYNFPMEIGASGEMSLKIKDTASFLIRLVGTETALTPEGLTKYFRALLMTRVKSYLARTIKERKLNIFEIDSQLDILSDAIKEKLVIDFGEYGIELKQFFISTVVRPEEDEGYRRLKQVQQQRYTDVFAAQTQQQLDMIQMQTDAQRRIMEAQSIAEKRKIEGYTYQEERSFDVAEKVAQNENVGQFTNMGIGMGMMAGIGGSIGSSVGSMVENAMNTTQNMTGIAEAVPPQMQSAAQVQEAAAGKEQQSGENRTRTCSCGAILPANAKFCFECGAAQPLCCPGCGSEITPGAKFCQECGQKI